MKRLVITFGLLMGSVNATLACVVEKATYRHLEDRQFSMKFSKQKQPKAWSDVQATLNVPNRKFDFEFTASNGYEVLSMVLLSKGVEQTRDIAVNFFDKNLKSLRLPSSGDAAPAYIFAPELGSWLWYSGLEPQVYIPAGIWKLEKC